MGDTEITNAGNQEEDGFGIMWIVLLIILALIFLAIALKCYMNTRRDHNRAATYKAGTPSVFKDEMDIKTSRKASQQQLHSSVGNDDGSATALLNTSGSDSEKAINSSSSQSKHIVVQPPPYP